MYTQKKYAEMAAQANREGKILEDIDGELTLVDPPPPPEPEIIVPESISPRQVRLALHAMEHPADPGKTLLDVVEEFVHAQGRSAEIEWEYAGDIKRDHPLVGVLVSTFGWSEPELNEFIIQADKL